MDELFDRYHEDAKTPLSEIQSFGQAMALSLDSTRVFGQGNLGARIDTHGVSCLRTITFFALTKKANTRDFPIKLG